MITITSLTPVLVSNKRPFLDGLLVTPLAIRNKPDPPATFCATCRPVLLSSGHSCTAKLASYVTKSSHCAQPAGSMRRHSIRYRRKWTQIIVRVLINLKYSGSEDAIGNRAGTVQKRSRMNYHCLLANWFMHKIKGYLGGKNRSRVT